MFSEFTKLELQAPTIKIQAVVFVLASVCASTRWRLLGGESGAAADRQYSAVHGYTREFGRVLIYQSYGKVILNRLSGFSKSIFIDSSIFLTTLYCTACTWTLFYDTSCVVFCDLPFYCLWCLVLLPVCPVRLPVSLPVVSCPTSCVSCAISCASPFYFRQFPVLLPVLCCSTSCMSCLTCCAFCATFCALPCYFLH